jgi:serine/threonine-protein kinase
LGFGSNCARISPVTGKTVGKYRILGCLGSGGTGTVYRAFDETLEREVAIKVLNQGQTDPKILKRFRAEATTLAKLNHPAIATIYELLQCDDELLIVMEFVRGETLERLALRMGLLTPEQAVFVVDGVLSALAHTHRAGIVHCDIKPANIIVTAHGGVKIMDFGTARATGAEHGTVHGYMMGTPAYMAPEQLLARELDGRTDLYAVGVLFYRLVTGTFPFTAETPIEAMRKQISEEPTPALAHRPGLPEWCDWIAQRALTRTPADRFQTADEFRGALREAGGFMTTELTKVPLPLAVEVAESSSDLTILEQVDARPQAIGDAHAARELPSPAILVPFPPNPSTVRMSRTRRRSVVRALMAVAAIAVPLIAVARMRAPSFRSRQSSPPVSASAAPSGSASSSVPAPAPPPAPELALGSETGLEAAPEPAPDPARASAVASRSESARAAPEEAPVLPVPAASLPLAAPSAPEPEKPSGSRTPATFTFQARVVAGDKRSSRECNCHVVLANGRITWRAEDHYKPIDAVPYDHVGSMVYSHGRDPLWKGPDGPTPVVRGSRGFLAVFAALGFFVERDWLSLRITDSRLRFVVLRFEDVGQAISAIDALEERTGRRIEDFSKRQS